ncbi:MAG: class I SAM-dependent methyltransferase [Anaerolineales bacterium]
MDIDEIRAELKALLADTSLFDETKLHARNEAIENIKYAGEVLSIPGYAGKLDPVYQQALSLERKLTAINQSLFERVREKISKGQYTPESLRATLDSFTNYTPGKKHLPDYETDGLDSLLEALFFPTSAPGESRKRIAGMIRYEATPARVVLEMIDNLRLMPDDIFFDIGSGLGFVVMLVNLLTNIRCVGIEYDPAYCEYARNSAQSLNLSGISFIQGDARNTNLNDGTIFYMFTPFVNQVFNSVLERLRYTAIRKRIYICSYGTITFNLAKLPWLQIRDPAMEHDFRLAVFTSK